jgi:hypothetical protein
LKGLLWTLLPRVGMPSNRVPSFAAGSMGGGWGGVVAAEVGNAAVLGNWISRRVKGVSVGKLVMGSLKRRTRWEPINYVG